MGVRDGPVFLLTTFFFRAFVQSLTMNVIISPSLYNTCEAFPDPGGTLYASQPPKFTVATFCRRLSSYIVWDQ